MSAHGNPVGKVTFILCPSLAHCKQQIVSPELFTTSGFGSGVNLSGLELGSIASGPGGLKESGGQQSRFKWMMEGHSPAPSPDDALHKNGEFILQKPQCNKC